MCHFPPWISIIPLSAGPGLSRVRACMAPTLRRKGEVGTRPVGSRVHPCTLKLPPHPGPQSPQALYYSAWNGNGHRNRPAVSLDYSVCGGCNRPCQRPMGTYRHQKPEKAN